MGRGQVHIECILLPDMQSVSSRLSLVPRLFPSHGPCPHPCVCVPTQLGWGQGSAALHQGLGAEIPMEAGEGRACKIGDS